MKCHLCHNEGTVYLTKVIDNKIQQFCYCQACALKQGLINTESSPPSSESLPHKEEEFIKPLTAHALLTCPSCGFSREKWLLHKRLGCAQCYNVFREDIKAYISATRDTSTHKGKSPKIHLPQTNSLSRKKILQEHLEVAIELEEYELAAQLRDEIAEL